jgi:hypothetical protein
VGKLKLTVNEEKTRICKVPEGRQRHFDRRRRPRSTTAASRSFSSSAPTAARRCLAPAGWSSATAAPRFEPARCRRTARSPCRHATDLGGQWPSRARRSPLRDHIGLEHGHRISHRVTSDGHDGPRSAGFHRRQDRRRGADGRREADQRKYCYRRGPRRAMIDKRLLQLAHYCRSIGYLRSLTTGAVRVALDGAAAGTVIDEPRRWLRHGWPPQPGASAPRALAMQMQQILHPQDDVTKLGACHA